MKVGLLRECQFGVSLHKGYRLRKARSSPGYRAEAESMFGDRRAWWSAAVEGFGLAVMLLLLFTVFFGCLDVEYYVLVAYFDWYILLALEKNEKGDYDFGDMTSNKMSTIEMKKNYKIRLNFVVVLNKRFSLGLLGLIVFEVEIFPYL
ncbi:hypothetical protein RJT34_02662 [Clitoria ternatea]|uniref:Uncharacterized protein n=1 Tax=Clitoria ternatea TaxID=43366 RepID=A0AAN9KKR4_CLITE